MQRDPLWTARTSLSAVLLLGLSGCATLGGGESISGQAPLSPQERRLQNTENAVAALNRRLDGIEARRGGDDSTRLSEEVRSLRGDLEKLTHDLRQQEQRSRQFYADLDQRLRQMEGGQTPAAGGGVGVLAPTAPLPPGAANQPAPTPRGLPSNPVQSAEEEASYLATFELLKGGKYDEAIRGFKGHLDKYPEGRYADNAAYWMAEANFVKRDYQGAATAFQRVVTQHPQSPRAPDALFKLALTQAELQQAKESRATLQQVIDRYPDSNAARLAQQRLAGN